MGRGARRVCRARAGARGGRACAGRRRCGGARGRRCRGGVLAAGPRGRQRGAAHDRRRACRARALPPSRSRAPARQRRRRYVGRRRGRLEAAARRLAAGVVVAARALRRRGDARTSSRRSSRAPATCTGRSRGREIAFPRWGGSRVDTRVAYLTRGRLHVVAGDGTRRRRVARRRARRSGVAARRPARSLRSSRRGGACGCRAPGRRRCTRVRERSRGRRTAACSRSRPRARRPLRRRDRTRPRRSRSPVCARSRTPATAGSRWCATVRSSSSTARASARSSACAGRLSGLAWSPNGRCLLTAPPGRRPVDLRRRTARARRLAHRASSSAGLRRLTVGCRAPTLPESPSPAKEVRPMTTVLAASSAISAD